MSPSTTLRNRVLAALPPFPAVALAVALAAAPCVTVIDGPSNATTAVAAGSVPQAVAVNQVSNKVYVANRESDAVTVIDGASNTTRTVVVGSLPQAIPGGDAGARCQSDGSNDVTVIDGASLMTTTIAAGTKVAAPVRCTACCDKRVTRPVDLAPRLET